MSGRSVLDEAIAGSGRLGDLHHELEELQHAMADPARAGDMDRDPRALRRGAGGVRAPRRLRARGAGARGAARAGLRRRADRRRRRRALGRLEDARRDGARAARPARRAADGRADQPPRHRVDHLARAVPQVAARRAVHDLARPRLHEPHRHARSPRSTAARSPSTRATTTSTSASARCARPTARRPTRASRRCSPRSSASSSASRRTPPRPRRCRAASRRSTRSRRSSCRRSASVVKFDFRHAAALGRPGGRASRTSHKAYGTRVIYDGLQPDHPPRRALGGDGQERRRQDDAAQDDRRRARARRGRGAARRQPEDGLLRAAVARRARSGPDRARAAAARLPARRPRRAAHAGRRVPVLRRRRRQEDPGAVGRREVAAGAWRACSSTRRTSWCSTSRPTTSIWRPRRCWSRRSRTSRARCSSSRTTAAFLRGLGNRVLELGGESGTDARAARLSAAPTSSTSQRTGPRSAGRTLVDSLEPRARRPARAK